MLLTLRNAVIARHSQTQVSSHKSLANLGHRAPTLSQRTRQGWGTPREQFKRRRAVQPGNLGQAAQPRANRPFWHVP